MSEWLTLLLNASLNLLVAIIIVRGIYYTTTPERHFAFAFLAFNVVTFFVLSVLGNIELSLGIGFGLFAIFSVLRYRTEEMPIREMTYLFTMIALPVMNASLLNNGFLELFILANGLVATILFWLERGWGFRQDSQLRVTYDRIELLAPRRRAELIADLRSRTGLPVYQVTVGKVDLVRDSAELILTYQLQARADSGTVSAASRIDQMPRISERSQ
ncbi:MAG: DUF4956 domain-containing protein [Chloroflexus sp.]|uniref:DUF4956 domain-containing protein n=1 Tax=Chloroflexus sp. TaxID=1904827 RepID=UPI0021DC3322|nr:MAG: DUF4956 domain-containing protein [Chloroflexus sp.]